MRSWAIPATCIVATEYLFALAIGASVGFHYSIPFKSYLIVGLLLSAVGVFAILASRLARRQFEAPLPWSFVAGVMLVSLQMAVLGWTKIMLPLATGFWADPLLADLDAAVFQTDPWRITHALFAWASPAIDAAYMTWAPIKFAALLVLLCLPDDDRKAAAMLSYFLIVSVGALSQYLLPSAGPVFYEQLGLGARFDALPVQPWVSVAAGYLWNDYVSVGGSVGTGISAMPSLHVATSLWIALVLRSYLPRLQALGWLYFSVILVGSVHLGWHYAVDAIAGALLSAIAWKAAILRRGSLYRRTQHSGMIADRRPA